MKTVRLNKPNLIEVLTKNRASHRALFEKAFDGYRNECIRILNQNLDSLKKNSRHVVFFTESPPEDHTEDYDRVLAMLAMSVDDTVELTSSEFSQYVQDDWSWKTTWEASNSKYGI